MAGAPFYIARRTIFTTASPLPQLAAADNTRIFIEFSVQNSGQTIIISTTDNPVVNGGTGVSSNSPLRYARGDIGDIIAYPWFGYAQGFVGNLSVFEVCLQG